MKFLLDSNAVIALMKGHSGFLTRLRQRQPRDFGISAIVAPELFYGAYRGQRTAENLARADALQFKVLELTARMRVRLASCARDWPQPARRSAPTTC